MRNQRKSGRDRRRFHDDFLSRQGGRTGDSGISDSARSILARLLFRYGQRIVIPVEGQDAPTRYEEVRKLAAQGKTLHFMANYPGTSPPDCRVAPDILFQLE
jgi:hypothetical protein